MRVFFFIAMIFACGVAGTALGGASAWWALDRDIFVQQISRGVWIAQPDFGQTSANPYSLAKSVQDPQLFLGPGEGVMFSAIKDEDGTLLSNNCNYRIIGNVPQTRLWTLAVQGSDGKPLSAENRPLQSINSRSLTKLGIEDLDVVIGPQVKGGNWFNLPAKPEQNIKFVLRFYDTNLSATTGLRDLVLPKLERLTCQS